MRRTLGSLRMEPDVENPPVRVWRDWLLVAGVAGTTMAEAVVRDGMVSRPVAIVFGVTLALTMLWRRTQPLAMVGLGFGALVVVDVASVVAVGEPFYPYAGAFVVVLVYSLFRWGTNRQAAIGFVIVLLEWLVSVTTDFTGVADASGGLVVLLFAAALGVSIRYRRIVVTQQFERVRFHEREMLARELHDTVAHHVSAIAIQAQAGQFLAKSRDLGGAAEALEVIEEEASRTLAEMRSMVGSFAGATAPRGCSPSVALPTSKVWPPPKEPRTCRSMSSTAAISTICDPRSRQRCIGLPRSRSPTQSVTHGTQRVHVLVAGDTETVRLSVSDNGERGQSNARTPGYGLVGMAERATLLGGTLEAGPGADHGWTVEAMIPRQRDRS